MPIKNPIRGGETKQKMVKIKIKPQSKHQTKTNEKYGVSHL
jgi:hypothetical protein